jgi:hypothetical protein
MPDHRDGPSRWRRATDDADQPGRRCVINAVIKYHRYRCPERGRGELPCLTSPACCGAQHLVGNALRIPEPPAHSGSIPATSAGKRPIVIWHRGPGRLGMADQHQPPALPRCHDHSVPGPIRQVSALPNALTASVARKPVTRPLSCVGVHRQHPPPHSLVADRRRGWPVAQVPIAARWPAPQRTGARVGRRPLFQPGHPRAGQVVLITPDSDQDNVALTGQAGRQCHLAAVEVTRRQLRKRHAAHRLRVCRGTGQWSPAPARARRRRSGHQPRSSRAWSAYDLVTPVSGAGP